MTADRDEQEPDYQKMLEASTRRLGKIAKGIHENNLKADHRKRLAQVMRLKRSHASLEGRKL